MADDIPELIEPDPQDLINAAVWLIRSAGYPYLETMSMVRHMAADAWQGHWSNDIETEQLPN